MPKLGAAALPLPGGDLGPVPASLLASEASGTSHPPIRLGEGQSLPELSAPPASAVSLSGPAARH